MGVGIDPRGVFVVIVVFVVITLRVMIFIARSKRRMRHRWC